MRASLRRCPRWFMWGVPATKDQISILSQADVWTVRTLAAPGLLVRGRSSRLHGSAPGRRRALVRLEVGRLHSGWPLIRLVSDLALMPWSSSTTERSVWTAWTLARSA